MSQSEKEIDQLVARIAALEEMLNRLSRISGNSQPATGNGETQSPALGNGSDPGSRRQLFKLAGVTALGAVGAAAMTGAQPAEAANGDGVTAGNVTKAERRTSVKYDGTSGFGGVVFLGNDSTYDGGSASFPAGVGGWAGAGGTAGSGGVPNGMYGYTDNGNGNGIVGVNSNLVSGAGNGVLGTAQSATGAGVKGTNVLGTAVYGSSGSTDGGATAIIGILTSTTPGFFSSAVRGQNNGTGGSGIGVWGSQAGSGWGGYFTSAAGIGLNATGGSGTGVNATGATGVNAFGDTIGLAASSIGGRGIVAAGNAAQIQLTPGSAATHPTAGAAGDLYVDSTARLWLCRGGTSWVELTARPPTGQFHVLPSPVRVYDSRPKGTDPASTGDGPLTAGSHRTVSLVKGFVGKTPAPAVPAGALAALFSLTVLNTRKSGFLTAFSNAVSSPGTFSITWYEANSRLTNSVTSAVDAAAMIKLHCSGTGAEADFVIDVAGYYE